MRVLYFASIRELFDCDGEQIELEPNITTVQGLIDSLCNVHDERWAKALGDPNLLVSINQEIASLDAVITNADEIAFFPPVTGG
ncbi:MAG: molybdopterin converting factor subunit 1 [Pseudomonadales bacterium]|nr:molybdopterin converting factor subunit 1 [Pseudomonadales bacterium]